MSGTLTRKIITVTFRLQSGAFPGTNSNTATVAGLRVWFRMSQVGGVSRDAVQIVIFGLTQSIMNALSTYGMPPDQNFNNEVTVQAGDATGLSTVFQGTILSAYADLNRAPEAAFVVSAYLGQYIQVAPAPSTSYRGPTDAATIMGNLAQQMGYTLENSGVSVQISNPYLSGSLIDQMRRVANAGNFYAILDNAKSVLAIWPKGQSRNGQTLTIGPTSGLVGYPQFTLTGVRFTAVWNPNLVYGQQFQLQSSLPNAAGIYVPMAVETALQSETPNGDWFMTIDAWATKARGA